MKRFGDIPGTSIDWVQIMRDGNRNKIANLSEYNFIGLLAALQLFADGGCDEFGMDYLPPCVQEYLEKASAEKRATWFETLALAAHNLLYEKLFDDAPIERGIYQTCYAAEDAILYIIRSGYDEFDPDIRLPELLPLEILAGLSHLDPPDEEDDEDRVIGETDFSEAIENMMDDLDIEFLYTMDYAGIKLNAIEGHGYDYILGNGTLYSRLIEVTKQCNFLNFHPDCWFIHWWHGEGLRTVEAAAMSPAMPQAHHDEDESPAVPPDHAGKEPFDDDPSAKRARLM